MQTFKMTNSLLAVKGLGYNVDTTHDWIPNHHANSPTFTRFKIQCFINKAQIDMT